MIVPFSAFGFHNGFAGLIEGAGQVLDWASVSRASTNDDGRTATARTRAYDSQRRAGSILGVSRRTDPLIESDKKKILSNLKSRGTTRRGGAFSGTAKGLVVIGGLAAGWRAVELSEYFHSVGEKISVVYVPSSIDHGLPGTATTIGFDSALNVIVEACDGIRDHSEATGGVSIVETMGRTVGALALTGMLASGAELALIEEDIRTTDDAAVAMRALRDDIDQAGQRQSATIVVREHLLGGSSDRLHGRADEIFSNFQVRMTALGYTQRGGQASYLDRSYGTKMGVEAARIIVGPYAGAWAVTDQGGGSIKGTNGLSLLMSDWDDRNRMRKAKPLWGYDEIKRLTDIVGIYREPHTSATSSATPRPRSRATGA